LAARCPVSGCWPSCTNGRPKISYISPIRPEARRGRMCTKFGTAVEVADIITCDKCFGDLLMGVDSVRGRKLPSPIDYASRH